MNDWKQYLDPSRWEIVARAPGNFFLAGEHAVMFGHPAVVQAVPRYFYVGVRRRSRGGAITVHTDHVNFTDNLDPTKVNQKFTVPTPMIACQLEHLLSANGWTGIDVGLYSEMPSMCGLASSGAVAAALSIALHYLTEREVSRAALDEFLRTLSNPTRRLADIIRNPIFCRSLFPLAWTIDSLFHNHQSSGTNPFFALVGSPDGLPAIYRQTIPRKGDIDTKPNGYNPSRTVPQNSACPDFQSLSACFGKSEQKEKCPDVSQEMALYAGFPYEARSLSEDYPTASSDMFNFCCALIYSGRPKTTELAIRSVKKRVEQVGSYFELCPFLGIDRSKSFDVIMAYIGSVSQELWQAIGKYFATGERREAEDVIQIIGFAQSALRNLLGISTDGIDYICRQAQFAGFEAKLTGAGKGGDVLVLSDGDGWKKLMEFQDSMLKDNSSLFRVHFLGRWFARDFVCFPQIMKRSAHRFLVVLDIKGSQEYRKRGSKVFEVYTDLINNAAHSDGVVLAYRETDDQRVVAFENEMAAKRFVASASAALADKLGIECWCACGETPFDWAFLRELNADAEQSKPLADTIRALKKKGRTIGSRRRGKPRA